MILAQKFENITPFPDTAAAPINVTDPNLKIGDVISAILPYVFSIAGILLLLMLLAGGFQLMLSKGDPKAAQGAWGKITNAAIGFLIIFIAYWLTQLVGRLFNLPRISGMFNFFLK